MSAFNRGFYEGVSRFNTLEAQRPEESDTDTLRILSTEAPLQSDLSPHQLRLFLAGLIAGECWASCAPGRR